MLATTVTTALWLDGRPASGVVRWEWLRLLAVAMVTLLAALSGYPVAAVAMGAFYVAVNAIMVIVLGRSKPLESAVPTAA
jgi:hypothetical protein